MEQGEQLMRTDMRRFLRAARPFLLLGGFVALWWCLATGTAQASETPNPGLSASTKALGATVDQVQRNVEHAVEPVRRAAEQTAAAAATRDHQVRPVKTAAPVAETVRHTASPVRAAVTKTVHHTVTHSPVKPVLKATVATVRTEVVAPVRTQVLKPVAAAVVTPVIRATGSLLAATPLAPVLQPVLGPVLQPVVAPTLPGLSTGLQDLPGLAAPASLSAPLSGKTSSSVTAAELRSTSAATSASSDSGRAVASPSAATRAAQDTATPGSPVQHQNHSLVQTGSTSPASAQSGSGSGGAATTYQSGMSLTPPTSKTPISSPAGQPLGGPAYPPSSSPD